MHDIDAALADDRDLDDRLRDYQRRAIAHLWAQPRAMLMLDMGLGKTAAALQALTAVHLPALVVAPKRVAELTWPAEVERWRPDLSVSVAAGTKAKRRAALDAGADVTVLGIDNLADAPAGRWETIIFDESSLLKSRATNRWKAARRLAAEAPRVWLLTGTPAPNSAMDLWAQIYLLDRGERLERGITRFRERYFRSTGWIAGGKPVRYEPRPGAAESITAAIADIAISMSAADHLDLPPVTHVDQTFELPQVARDAYEAMRRDMVASLDESDVVAANAAVVTSKLSQITAGALIDGDEVHRIHEAKLDVLAEIIEGTGSPVLVFVRFRFERTAVLERFADAVAIEDGGAVARWCAGEIPILVAHPASAGHGLNLQDGGHTVAWTSPPWSAEQWVQANARLARQGQAHPVVIHRIVARQTIDAEILEVVEGKASAQRALRRALGI